jgi:hypothetical protein
MQHGRFFSGGLWLKRRSFADNDDDDDDDDGYT